jgi:hypothetical protein
MEPTVVEVNKGDDNWLQLSIDRRSRGLEIWVKTDPRVEQFMSSLAEEPKTTPLSTYGTAWKELDEKAPLKVWVSDREVASPSYRLDNVGGDLGSAMNGWNLSFLRIKDISTEGVTFFVRGPFDKEYVRTLTKGILTGSRQLFRDYIAPFHVNLRISSQEV